MYSVNSAHLFNALRQLRTYMHTYLHTYVAGLSSQCTYFCAKVSLDVVEAHATFSD